MIFEPAAHGIHGTGIIYLHSLQKSRLWLWLVLGVSSKCFKLINQN